MSEKICSNQSVGVVIERQTTEGVEYLLIERVNVPYGFAPPAGHVEPGETIEEAAIKEVSEEVGITLNLDSLVATVIADLRMDNNVCSRSGGDHHNWTVFRATVDPDIVITRSEEETHSAGWCSADRINQMAEQGALEEVWVYHFQTLGLLAI